jgi:exodeoxyribonuclease VII small subunit
VTRDLNALLRELRAICDRVESGKLPLAQILAEYERGVQLGREIDERLRRTEQRVDVIAPDGTLEVFPRTSGGSP